MARFKEMLMPIFRKEAAGTDKPMTTVLLGREISLAKLDAMNGAEFMEALLDRIGEQLDRVSIEFDSMEILGSVVEGDIVHVVTRIQVSARRQTTLRRMEVISAMPYEGGWKIMLTGQFEGLAASLSGE